METAKLVTQWLLIFGLISGASLYLISMIFPIAPASSLCLSFHSSLSAISTMCVEYLYYTWSLLSRQQDHPLQGPHLLTPRNLFLLVNLIIFFLLTSLHLQQHALAGRRRKSRRQHSENLINDQQAAVLQGSSRTCLAGEDAAAAAAPMARPGWAAAFAAETGLANPKASVKTSDHQSFVRLQGIEESSEEQLVSKSAVSEARDSMESLAIAEEESLSGKSAELAMENTESTFTSGSLVMGQGSSTVDCDGINGPDVEKITSEEDERLRLIEGSPPSYEATSQTESTDGLDAEKIVLEGDGRLRLIDRPQRQPSRCRPGKSHSTGDNYNHNHDYASDNNSGNNDQNIHNDNSFNDNNSNLRVVNYGYINPIHSHNLRGIKYGDINPIHSHNHSLMKDDLSQAENNHSLINDNLSHDHQQLQQQEAHGKSSSVLGNVSRPRKKKSDSMDATWKAINDSRGSAINASYKDPRRMISRQNSRHGFKARARPPVRREASINQEELNAKVESFIEKFNEQIRIQRQQSLLSYMQMVDRGA